MGILKLKGIRLIANLAIAFFILTGSTLILQKTHKLITAPEQINILKLDVPWVHPGDNVAILLDQNALARNPELHQKLQVSVFIYNLIERIVYISLFIIILILLKRLIISIYSKTFFDLNGTAIINRLAFVVGIYVVCEFLLYQLVPLFIPVDLMVETMNFSTFNKSILDNIVAATDFKLLFVGICLYVISVSFREGYKLKSEAELTI